MLLVASIDFGMHVLPGDSTDTTSAGTDAVGVGTAIVHVVHTHHGGRTRDMFSGQDGTYMSMDVLAGANGGTTGNVDAGEWMGAWYRVDVVRRYVPVRGQVCVRRRRRRRRIPS